MKTKTILASLVVLAALAVYPLWQGKFYAVGDMRDVTIPLELFFAQQQKAGHLPTWNPDIAFGFPTLASAQIGFYYPPLLLGRFLPIYLYLPILFFAHVVSAGLGMWYFLRHLKLSKQASLFGAAGFMLSSFIWQHSTHLNIFFAFSYLPWQLLATATLLKKPRLRPAESEDEVGLRPMHIIRAAFLFGIPLLIGQFQIQTISALTCIAYAFLHRPKKMAAVASSILMITAGAALLASAQLLPTAELTAQSSRGVGGQFNIAVANQHSFPIYHLPTLIFPRFFGTDDAYWGKRLEIEHGIFFGTLPLVAAAAYLLKFRHGYHRPLRFFVWLLPISFLLSLGSHSPFRWLGIEPSLWIFSAPARWLGVATFCACILAAAGFQHALPRLSFKIWGRLLLALGVIVIAGNIALQNSAFLKTVSFSALHYLHHQKGQAYYEDKFGVIKDSARQTSISFSSPYTYLPLLTIAAVLAARRSQYYAAVMMVATLAELLVVATTTTRPAIPWTDTLRPPATLALLPKNVREREARLYSIRQGGDIGGYFTDPRTRASKQVRQQQRDLLVPLISAQFGIAGIEWPASLDMKRVHAALAQLRGEEGYEIKDANLLGQFGIGAILAPPGISLGNAGTKIAQTDAVAVYEIPAAPRVSLVDSDKKETALSYTSATPAEITTHVSADTNGTVVIRDLNYPGWRATVDNQPVAISDYSPFFRSVPVAAGSHVITMTYQPKSVAVGLRTSIVTFVAFCIMLILTKRHDPVIQHR